MTTRTVAGDMPLDTNVAVVAVDLSTGDAWIQRTHNVTCEGGHEALLDLLNPFGEGKVAGQLAIGVDGASGASTTDRSLNAEVGRSRVRFGSRSGRTLTLRAFAPSQLTDSDPIDELGLALGTSDGTDLVNHAAINNVDKSSPDTILIATIELSIEDTSEV